MNDWLLTGDRARRDAGRLCVFPRPRRRRDFLAGYRIGPVEIEDSLLRHPAVANAAAVGKPDFLRGKS